MRAHILSAFLLLSACTAGETSISRTDQALEPGSACTTNSDCDSEPGAGDGFCYAGNMGGGMVFPPEGYCTVDDGTGTVCSTDGDCPGSSQCIDLGGYRLCLPSCGPGGTCPEHQACFDEWGGLPLDKPSCVPGDAAAVDGDGCAAFYDCNASSECWNDEENPGGSCSAYACTIGTDEGCHGGRCIEFEEGPATGTICVAPCTDDSECRVAEGYVCTADGYCRHPHAGDPCADASDCSGGAWSCLTDGHPDGYCTLTGCPTPGTIEGCGAGAVCADLDGPGGSNQCLDRCPTIGSSATCRAGYTCADIGAVNGGGCVPE